jgi:hypothetical protein
MNKLLLTFLALTAGVQAETLNDPLQGSAFIAPSVYNGSFLGLAGNCNGYPSPGWHVAQWNIPQDLLPGCGRASWMIANSHAKVRYLGDAYVLSQNGNTTALACGKEFDLYLETNNPRSYSDSPDGFMTSKSIAALTSLRLNVTSLVSYEAVAPRCSVNYVGYVVAMVLTNPAAKQTLFYQIVLRDSRGGGYYPWGAWCGGNEAASNGTFCVDDDIRGLQGYDVDANGAAVYNSIDVLWRVRQILSSQHVKRSGVALNSDMNGWKLQNLYFGQKLQGGVVATSQWSGMSLDAN